MSCLLLYENITTERKYNFTSAFEIFRLREQLSRAEEKICVWTTDSEENSASDFMIFELFLYSHLKNILLTACE